MNEREQIEEDLNRKIQSYRNLRKYLEEHPELEPFQAEIEAHLSQVGTDPIERSYALQTLLCKSAIILREHMMDLNKMIEDSNIIPILTRLANKKV